MMEEELTPAELFLGMQVGILHDECPFSLYQKKLDTMDFCIGEVEEEGDEFVFKCDFLGDGTYPSPRRGVCWARFARRAAGSDNSPEEVGKRVWRYGS